MNSFKVFAVILVGFAPLVCSQDSQDKPLTIQQLEQLENLNKAQYTLRELEAVTTKISTTCYSKCLRAFGHHTFCDCLGHELPIGASFSDYITIVTSSMEDLEYESLTDDYKALVDNTLLAREKCVARWHSESTD